MQEQSAYIFLFLILLIKSLLRNITSNQQNWFPNNKKQVFMLAIVAFDCMVGNY